MDKETKYCITVIIVAFIWFMSQPMGGNMSVSANFDRVPYFNLTNATISGHAEISGYIPIGIIMPMLIINAMTTEQALFVYFTILALAFAYYIFKIIKGK
jgi:hypothetical protein